MSSKKLGETKGPFIVWLFVTLCFIMSTIFRSSSGGALPQDITMSLVLSLLINMTIPWGVVLVFLTIFGFLGEEAIP